ncbi:MAG: NAD(P)-dependent alcohol dehydrogenase [Pseudomonadota bacterium]
MAIKANSLNARDLMVASRMTPMPVADELVPLSDGAGIVEEVGDDVTRVQPGDRVVITFNPAHQSGPYEAHMAAYALGEMRSGVLTREAVFEEMALVKLPDEVTFEQAACLPCVALTAWNALFEAGPLMPGQTVVTTGTGMVSLATVTLSKAAGVQCGVTSSEDDKIELARELGADFGINYLHNRDWDSAVLERTGGEGAHVVVETAGPPSIATSVKAAAQNGRVMQIGLKGLEGPAINPLDLLVRGVRVIPVMVGSRAMLERLVAAVSFNNVTFPIAARFPFEEADQAFASFARGGGFGKTIILHQ